MLRPRSAGSLCRAALCSVWTWTPGRRAGIARLPWGGTHWGHGRQHGSTEQAALSPEGAASGPARWAGGAGLPGPCSFSSSSEAWSLAAGLLLQVKSQAGEEDG